jgi:signal transduction histidine kinase/ligand-binding sensor domain-containing protein
MPTGRRVETLRRILIAIGTLLACASRAAALNPLLDVSQYAHTAWKVSEGLARGVTFAIAQTPDGYLWLGTEAGLLRFDGVRAVEWQPRGGERLPSSDIRRLYAARDGRLWLGTFAGLASVKDGHLTRYRELDGQRIDALLEDRDGAIWAAGSKAYVGRLCRIWNDTTQCYGEDGRFGSAASALYQDRAGNLWAGGTPDLWRWTPGPPTRYPMPDPANAITAVLELDDGALLVSKRSGLTTLRNGKTEAYLLPDRLGFQPGRLFRDHDGGLWIGALTDRGLLHVHDGTMDLFTRSDGLSGNSVSQIFEDREGSVWVVTLDGIDRFRNLPVPTVSIQQGLSSESVSAVLAATDGSLWFGTNKGLDRWHGRALTAYRRRPLGAVGDPWGSAAGAGWSARLQDIREVTQRDLAEDPVDSLYEDHLGRIWITSQSRVAVLESDRIIAASAMPNGIVFSITEDRSGNVWIGHQDGLFRLRDARVLERIPWSRFGRTQPATAIRYDPQHDGLWLGFRDGGVADFANGQVRAWYGRSEGLPDSWVTWLHIDGTHTLWAATQGGVGRIKDGRASMLTTRNGLPCDTVHWITDDDVNAVWLYTACGLVRIARTELDAWARNPDMQLRPTVFDANDGVPGHPFPKGYSPMVAKSRDGRIWFITVGGVSVINPAHLPFNALLPPVRIEQIVADGKVYAASSGRELPALVRDLQIDYTALSFVAPEKNRFRVMLDGRDRDWQDVGARRQAYYTDLGPGAYRFRVMGSNNSGVWNETGATLEFSIAPAYYQTRWFAALVLAGTATLLWVAYQLRIAQLARQFNRTLEARVNERTRIARDLHDTLLQSFQGALLRFHAVSNVIKTRPDEASERLERALDQAEAAIIEGRNTVRGLRASATMVNDLANGIAAIGAELTSDPTAVDSPVIRVDVDGASRDLNPIVRDEAFRIAGEALRNAVKHARARQIGVTIHYEPRQLRLVIRDDGRGIDRETMQRQQSTGHFGLPGMRERAAVVRGQLDVRSTPGSGTAIELRVPGATAYRSRRQFRWSRLFGAVSRVDADGGEA